jgi:translation initiation factor 3 subunit L
VLGLGIEDESGVFSLIYKELYYRHIYTKLHPTGQQRVESWSNYADLFETLIDTKRPVPLALPTQWIWDIVDEFVYQFQSWCHQRAKARFGKTGEEDAFISSSDAWGVEEVISYLERMAEKAQVSAVLAGHRESDSFDPATLGPFAANQTYFMLGYFSLISLARVHCLVGDYSLALETLGPIDISKKNSAFARVTACHITLYYYLGFAYMMLRRYSDTIRTLNSVLTFIGRTKQYHQRSSQYDSMMKKTEQMYALLAVCVSLCPNRVDEHVHTTLREKLGEKMLRMQRGEEPPYEELFSYACPKFIGLAAASHQGQHSDAIPASDPYKHQLRLFMDEVRIEIALPTIRSVLRLYSSISITKLSGFLDKMDPQRLTTLLMALKSKSRQLQWSGHGTAAAQGSLVNASDFEFYIEDGVVHVVTRAAHNTYSDFFVRHITKLRDLNAEMESL